MNSGDPLTRFCARYGWSLATPGHPNVSQSVGAIGNPDPKAYSSLDSQHLLSILSRTPAPDGVGGFAGPNLLHMIDGHATGGVRLQVQRLNFIRSEEFAGTSVTAGRLIPLSSLD